MPNPVRHLSPLLALPLLWSPLGNNAHAASPTERLQAMEQTLQQQAETIGLLQLRLMREELRPADTGTAAVVRPRPETAPPPPWPLPRLGIAYP